MYLKTLQNKGWTCCTLVACLRHSVHASYPQETILSVSFGGQI